MNTQEDSQSAETRDGAAAGAPERTAPSRRELADRRRRVWWSILYGNVKPRRRAPPRRMDHTSYHSVDWHAAHLLAIAIGISLLSVADAFLTLVLLQGGAADIIAQVGLHQGRKIFAFTREGDIETQKFARSLGATWSGGSDERPPEPLDAAIIFAPVGALVPKALAATVKGGCVVCGGIHMSPIPEFSYDLLWGERTICSVANLTRQDGKRFLELAPTVPVRTEIRTFPLEQVNEALAQLRAGAFRGSAVLIT